MAEIVIAPQGQDAIEVGGFVDDEGQRFVAAIFKRDDGDPVIVTFTTELFHAFAGHLGDVSKAVSDESYWRTVPRR